MQNNLFQFHIHYQYSMLMWLDGIKLILKDIGISTLMSWLLLAVQYAQVDIMHE